MPIRIVQDTAQAQRYMMARLSESTTLAGLVLERVNLEQGRFRVLIPEAISESEFLDFGSGNVRLVGDEEAAFASIVRAFISDPGCALLVQDNESKISDPVLQHLPYRKLAIEYKDEVYWRVSGSDLSQLSNDEMLDIVHSASWFPWTGFFYLQGIPLTRSALNGSDLKSIVTNLVGVSVSAFDFRSFLIWWRDELIPFVTLMSQE